MGVRFKKSINLGGGFRVNLSKSGVGYSWGGKGYRITKSAKGKVRTTNSIPGTGLSYTQEFGRKKKATGTTKNPATAARGQSAPDYNNNYYDVQEIKNADATTLVSEGLEEMIAAASKSLRIWRTNNAIMLVSLIAGLFFPPILLLMVACLVFGFYLKKHAIIDMQYTFEEDQVAEVEERMAPLIKIANSKKVWWVSQSSKVLNTKYSGGASSSIKRENCKVATEPPFPFKTNATAVAFTSGSETLLFMPDKLFIIQGCKIGALNYSDVTTSVHGQNFIERGAVPKDAQIVDYTWQYVNKTGGPDKRYQNNKKLPICLYGEMEIRSANGVNTDILFSNINIQ